MTRTYLTGFALFALADIALGQLAPLSVSVQENVPELASHLGEAVGAGDINGDGYDDVILGAPRADVAGLIDAGRVVVRFGPGFVTSTTIQSPAPQANADFGTAVACGDVNGDGFDDLVVGSKDDSVGAVQEAGRVYVFFGPALATNTSLVLPAPTSSEDFGTSVVVGDWNGDGRADIAAGAPEGVVGGVTAGRVGVFDGATLSLIAVLDAPTPQSGDEFGWALAAVDVDADGDDDLLVGAPGAAASGISEAGRVHVYTGPNMTASAVLTEPTPALSAEFGRTLAAGDINGDGFGDVAVEVGDGQPGGVVDAGEVVVWFGPSFTSSILLQEPVVESGADFGSGLAIGDTNGDGFDDLVVGAEDASAGGALDAGEAYLFRGPSLSSVSALIPSVVNADDDFGIAAAMGDFNGDGLADALIGAKDGEVTTTSDQGRAFVFVSAVDMSLSAIQLSVASGGTLVVTLAGGASKAARPYAMLATPLGSDPGFHNGSVNVPINVHPTITPVLLTAIPGALGVLNGAGSATLLLGVPGGVLPASTVGFRFTFAWLTTDVFNYASYPVVFEVSP